MTETQDVWRFMRMRAAQLFEEGDARAALKLLKKINLEQARKLDEEQAKCERIENC